MLHPKQSLLRDVPRIRVAHGIPHADAADGQGPRSHCAFGHIRRGKAGLLLALRRAQTTYGPQAVSIRRCRSSARGNVASVGWVSLHKSIVEAWGLNQAI